VSAIAQVPSYLTPGRFSTTVSELAQLRQQLASDPLRNGAAVVGVSFDGTHAVTVAHQLARPWRGWFVTRAYAGAGLAAPALIETATQPSAATAIGLISSTACKVDLWVF
jgi:hypothetical protein